MNDKIIEVLVGLKYFQGVYERDMVNAAIELRDEITPHLIAILENLLSNPSKYIENPDLFDHNYAVMLLGHFGEARAHKTLIDVFSLPNRMSNDLFGDIATEDLPMILLRTCNGSLEHIKAMALNKNADDYCRASALHAMAYATITKIASREEVLAFYGSLFSGQEADNGSELWGLLACLVYELYPKELMDTISRAFEDGLINPGMIDYQSFERALRRDKNSHLEDLRKDFKRRSLDNIHDSMSWWACFNPEPEEPLPMDYPPESLTGMLSNRSQKQKRAKKKKRKMAKASKRKNRR
ncbi:MAG: DUF1186 domain-containing protein [Desulfobacterales bacterium]|jgi:hypothetical protein